VADVLGTMEALALPLQESPPPYEIRRFSGDGCVIVRGTTASVFIGGTLIGEFDEHDLDRGRRNILAVTLAKTGVLHLGQLAAAFGITDEYLRQLRRKEETKGLGALLLAKQGKESKVTPAQRAAWCAMFAAGQMPIDAYRAQPKPQKKWLSYPTVWRVYEKWQRERDAQPESTAPPVEAVPPALPRVEGQLAFSVLERATPTASDSTDELDEHTATPDEGAGAIAPMTTQPVRGGKLVQHAGCWMLLALAHELGLHDEANRAFNGRHADGLRIALDAVICALAIRQQCIEGVRRLATPSGPTLLRAARVPSANGIRKLLGRLLDQVDAGGTTLDARMADRFIAAARADDGPAVFYIDNHLRPYTGKQVIRKGWRMQARRVLPGSSDYYVHDEDGRPVFRIAVASHDSLTTWLMPIASRLRAGLGEGERIVLAFDRAGSHAEQLAELRDADFDFVTYERKPYPDLPTTAVQPATIAGEHVGLHESRARNLGAGRGRVRRIAVRTEDGRQVNFLAISNLPAERLIEILWHRWRQENGFKHGVERWGINQLDDRSVAPYPPGTIIPNPARRKLDRALRLARHDEGEARRVLARLAKDDPQREVAEADLADALNRQEELAALRPYIPLHAPVEKTVLADKLVQHTGKLKTIVDVIRVTCANAESDLAALLAPHMPRPREAKKLLSNIFAAPGKVAVTDHAIHVRLAPAATRSERGAIQHLFDALNQRALVLPADQHRLPLRFELQPL
jgi:hypothetical protein